MISHETVWGVCVIEDVVDDICFYTIAIFRDKNRAENLKQVLQENIDDTIDNIQDNGDEFFTEEHCKSETLKQFIVNANLNEGIRVVSCDYKILIQEDILYK